MSDRGQFIVLCEDRQAQVFICRALQTRGVERRKIRTLNLPSGGAGDAYVIRNYPREVKAFRRCNARATYGLVVHLDADPGHTVAQRHAQLAQQLKEEALLVRQTGEPIAELVPKRNIETWIYALDRALLASVGQLDEETEYAKLHYREGECAKAAKAFAKFASGNSPPTVVASVPSLTDGLGEFGRLPK